MKFPLASLAILLFGLFQLTAVAAEQDPGLEQARQQIVKTFSDAKPTDITPSPIPGLYQVMIPPRLFYASADGRYLFSGDVIDVQRQQNLSKDMRDKAVITAINDLGEENMIVFGKDTLKHTITVFTDIDCTYCRKLHSEIAEYNKLGIRIRYLAYPRAGLNSASSQKAEAVWCSKDRQAALTAAKSGQIVKAEKCDNPVAKEYTLGKLIGVRGTPALVLEDGTVVPGYIPPQRLKDGLDNFNK